MKVLMAEVNISEGKDLDLVEQVKAALLDGEAVDVMDINSNANHNRTVFTYKGSPEAVLDGTKRLAAKAIELIDMTKHTGSHPRIGAVDVVPFIPVKDVSIDEALVIARALANTWAMSWEFPFIIMKMPLHAKREKILSASVRANMKRSASA